LNIKFVPIIVRYSGLPQLRLAFRPSQSGLNCMKWLIVRDWLHLDWKWWSLYWKC